MILKVIRYDINQDIHVCEDMNKNIRRVDIRVDGKLTEEPIFYIGKLIDCEVFPYIEIAMDAVLINNADQDLKSEGEG